MARYPRDRSAQASRAVYEVEALLVETAALLQWFAADGAWRARRRRRSLHVRRAVGALLLRVLAPLALMTSALVLAGRWVATRMFPSLQRALAAPVASVDSRPAGATVSETTSAAQLANAATGWLERQRWSLPATTHEPLRAIVRRVVDLAVQPDGLPAESEELRLAQRLIAEELPELVESYRRIPSHLTEQVTPTGTTPHQQLLSGLILVDDQLAQLQERLADRDLRALSTHFRYLALKYAPDGELLRAPLAPALQIGLAPSHEAAPASQAPGGASHAARDSTH